MRLGLAHRQPLISIYDYNRLHLDRVALKLLANLDVTLDLQNYKNRKTKIYN